MAIFPYSLSGYMSILQSVVVITVVVAAAVVVVIVVVFAVFVQWWFHVSALRFLFSKSFSLKVPFCPIFLKAIIDFIKISLQSQRTWQLKWHVIIFHTFISELSATGNLNLQKVIIRFFKGHTREGKSFSPLHTRSYLRFLPSSLKETSPCNTGCAEIDWAK